MEDTLLVELLTEELPPRSLRMLGDAFADLLVAEIVRHRLKDRIPRKQVFATPRRLAVLIPEVREKALESAHTVEGPASSNTKAVEGFARKYKVTPESLERVQAEKGEIVVARFTLPGVHLDNVLASVVEGVLKKLPVPKMMRWGSGAAQFARPVHGLVMLHGSRVVPGEVLGTSSSNKTLGHRFISGGTITLKHADDYVDALSAKGKVTPDFTVRRAEIAVQLHKAAGSAALVADDALLDEIAAIVEDPTVYAGEFSAEFLAVPEECLILSMQQHQKYVPLRDKKTGKLLPRFLFVSNIETNQPHEIIHGNERVLRARLSDARFFYDQDRKTRLEDRVPKLANVVYHNRLGSQLERVERVQLLAGKIARELGADPLLAERAAWLSKADLLTDMVGEFPELQGIMGSYYAHHDGEKPDAVEALADQYRLRYENSGDMPVNLVSASLYVADRIDALVGLFGIGESPTGEKDPYGLRRSALGVISVYELLGAKARLTGSSLLDVRELLDYATTLYPSARLSTDVSNRVHEFILDRYWYQLATIYAKDVVEAVISKRPPLAEVTSRVQAVKEFQRLPDAASLATANKRIRNILRKSETDDVRLNDSLLQEPAERELHASLRDVMPRIAERIKGRDYTGAMQIMAALRGPVDTFFDKVLVNAEDMQLRNNRHALLRELDTLMNQVADISKLAV